MNKKKKTGTFGNGVFAASAVQRDAMQSDLEGRRMETVREIERVLSEISKKKKGKSLRMKHPSKLGSRPNDTVEE